MTEKKVPTSRLSRLVRLGALGAKAGSSRLASMMGGADAEAQLAETAADALGNLRGLAAKVGQMASYVDGIVPEEHRDVYEKAMGKLRNAAPTMTDAEAAAIVESELGATPDELFATWSASPFASASIGQVHRATMKDGRDVAVKIQYEGIDSAVKADLNNASLFGSLMGPLGGKLKVKEQLAEVRERFLEELDYEHEAAQQQRFADIYADDEQICIPQVVAEHSAKRVITSEFAAGRSFEEACAATEAERRAWAETLWRFVFVSLLENKLFNADPHPGNYIFGENGSVWFLDFGCTRELSSDNVALVRDFHRHASVQSFEQFYEVGETMFGMGDVKNDEVRDIARDYMKTCFAPIWTKGEYLISRDYAASLVKGVHESSKKVFWKYREDFKPLPPQWLFFNRLQMGFYSVLARLNVAVDYNALEIELLAGLKELES